MDTGFPHGDGEHRGGPAPWSEYYGDKCTLPGIHRHLTNMGPFIARCEQHFRGSRILEIGTGTGTLAVYFSQRGYAVTGLDYDVGIIASNRRLNRALEGRARFVLGDMFNLPFPPAAFDACYHQGLMEHFDPPDIIRALHAQLDICRRVVFAVPTRLWTGGRRGDERMWSGKHWLGLLAGFQVLDLFGMAYGGLPARAVNAAGQRLTGYRPAPLYRHLALTCAGQIGFVIAHKA